MATQAQARQSAIDSLDSIGSSRADYDQADVFTAAEEDVARFIERVQENIRNGNMIVTGKIDDIGVVITPGEINITGSMHVLYQDRGVQGAKSSAKAPNSPHKYTDKMPPLEVFIEYVKKKNLLAVNQAQFFEGESQFKEYTDEEKIKRIAQQLQVMTYRYGFKPRNIFSKEIPELRKDLSKSIKNFSRNAIQEVFNNKKI